MDKIIKRCVLLLLMIVFMVPNMQTMAASKKTLNKRALKAYRKVLEKREFSWTSYGSKWKYDAGEFTIIDVNRDGIKEMITQHDKWGTKFLWVLKGKKAKPVIAFNSYQGCGIGYSKKLKAIVFPISMTVGIDADGFIRMKSRTKVNLFEWGTRYSYNSYTQQTEGHPSWYIDGKSVSERTFWKKAKANASINSLSKSIVFYPNNAANRKKIKKLKAY